MLPKVTQTVISSQKSFAGLIAGDEEEITPTPCINDINIHFMQIHCANKSMNNTNKLRALW